MRKTFMIATLVALFSLSCGNKKEETTQQDAIQEVAPKASNEVKVELTDFDRYEGKIVHASTGQWYLIKEGARWRTNSIPATDDYLKTLPAGPDYVVENVPIETLKQFPEVGEIYPHLEYKKDVIKTAK
ncbi:hypothetical protein ACM55I_05760 [Flavobacterium sp. GB2R13]|uniref:hypothetical protein n=1 Tax=Flavobacterium algoris TaxID=3398733 RepID=UPI003A8474A1